MEHIVHLNISLPWLKCLFHKLSLPRTHSVFWRTQHLGALWMSAFVFARPHLERITTNENTSFLMLLLLMKGRWDGLEGSLLLATRSVQRSPPAVTAHTSPASPVTCCLTKHRRVGGQHAFHHTKCAAAIKELSSSITYRDRPELERCTSNAPEHTYSSVIRPLLYFISAVSGKQATGGLKYSVHGSVRHFNRSKWAKRVKLAFFFLLMTHFQATMLPYAALTIILCSKRSTAQKTNDPRLAVQYWSTRA